MSNERMRIDKWLWVARFFKTRSLASMAIASHKIGCNGDHVKPARDLKVGDELEITIGQTVFVVIVQGMAEQDVYKRQHSNRRTGLYRLMKFIGSSRNLKRSRPCQRSGWLSSSFF